MISGSARLPAALPKWNSPAQALVKKELKGYFSQLTSEWEMIHYTIDEYIAQGDQVVALGTCSFRNKRTGKVLDTPEADFHRFRDGKICEFFDFYDTAQAISQATPD